LTLSKFTNGPSCPAQETGDGYQHHATDQGDHDLTQPTSRGQTEKAEQPATDDASQQSDDQISKEAVAAPFHHQTGEPASYNATYDPEQDTHSVFTPLGVFGLPDYTTTAALAQTPPFDKPFDGVHFEQSLS
jgi:hypothetical protein